ncbi:hypothetical protein, partial [Streptomyces sp. NPDC055085]
PEPIRELLAAINETLTLPAPAGDRDDLVRYETCVTERIHLVQLTIRDLLAGKDEMGPAWETDYLRRRIAARPPRYRTTDQYIADLRQAASEVKEP